MKKIGMLTSGGDCQALNATMRGVAKGLFSSGEKVEVYGFIEGYRGLMQGNYRKMSEKDFSGILTKGDDIHKEPLLNSSTSPCPIYHLFSPTFGWWARRGGCRSI